jgi:hypothetical protein
VKRRPTMTRRPKPRRNGSASQKKKGVPLRDPRRADKQTL